MAVNKLGGIGLGLVVGAAIGGTVALLYTPKSGREARELMRSTVTGARHSLGERISGEECTCQ